ncbi:hypothetical protein ABXI76_27100 [Streptomyces parvus]
MSASDWARLLDDPQSIQSLYEEEPDLNQCDLFHVLADERGDSITLGTVSIRRVPDEKLSVAITSDKASLLFRARSVVLSAARVGLVSSSV